MGPANVSAADVYASRVEALRARQQVRRRRDRVVGVSKLAVAAGALIAAVFVMRSTSLIALAGTLGLLFIALAVWHEKILNAMRSCERVIAYYERGLARLQHRWMGSGETGERFLNADHAYARDLDIFGNASLFQYLWAGRTRTGEETLANWLLHPAAVNEIAARQPAVRELAPLLELRENLWSAGETVRNGVEPDAISAWGEHPPILMTPATRILTTGLALLWVLSVVYWAGRGAFDWALLMTVLNFAYAHKLGSRWERAAATVSKAEADLLLLSAVLRVMESRPFTSPKLAELQAGLQKDGVQASAAIRKLARIVEFIEGRDSLFGKPLDLVVFWSAQLIFAAERWQKTYGPSIRIWLKNAGEMEALSSLATHAYEHPEDAFPEFGNELLFYAEGMAHPLLAATAVTNDVTLEAGRQLMILSGPNMAGKSTFMRSMGVNAVLAQCGAPVRARRLRMSPLQVAASICILDSLSGGVSRFYAEIQRLKMIADLADGSVPVLFLLDELLSGTNSHDRFIGTEFVLRRMVERGAIGIVSTHDLALTRIADEMGDRAFNAHFDDRVEQGKLIFDYTLKPGVVQTSNALKLMRAIGLGVDDPS